MKKVWVNGTFDVLHLGHIKLLEFAKSQGDYLCVGIDSDLRIKTFKGPDRPINKVHARLEFLSAIKFVDRVVIFNSDEELIIHIKVFDPDIFVIGSDYKNKKVIGAEYAKQLIYFDRLDGYSSTFIINGSTNNL
jgi:D-beta-D-heptose 7-phosphate kinase/D-beta-D-heptose 1-phosphate adenosyltransferase